MKSAFKFLGIIVLTVLIALTMSTCEEDNGGIGGGGSNVSVTADFLKLAGKVWTFQNSMTGYSFKEFKGDVGLSDIASSGVITNGSLNFTVGVIDTQFPFSHYLDYLFNGYDVAQSDSDVFYHVIKRISSRNSNYFGIQLIKYEVSASKYLDENVSFIYVTKPVRLTAEGWTDIDEYGEEVYESIDIQLTQGWNAISSINEGAISGSNYTFTRSFSKLNSVSSSYTWVISERYNND